MKVLSTKTIEIVIEKIERRCSKTISRFRLKTKFLFLSTKINLCGNPSECLSSRIRIYHFKVNMSKLVRKQNCLFSCPSSQFTHHDNTRKVFKVDFKC